METHSHPKVEPLRRIIGLLFLAATVAAVLSAVVSSGAVNQPGSPEQAAALRKIAPWVTQHTAGGKQAEFMIILTDQADVSGAAFMQTKAAKDLRVTLNPCHVGTRRQRERVFIATFYPDRVDDVEGTMLKLMECRARNDLWKRVRPRKNRS